jgi:hypothetical protein
MPPDPEGGGVPPPEDGGGGVKVMVPVKGIEPSNGTVIGDDMAIIPLESWFDG